MILARKLKRKVDNGSCISYNNKYYIPYENNSILTFKAKTLVTVIDSPITSNKFIEGNYSDFGLADEFLIKVADTVSPYQRLKRALKD